MTMKKTYCPAGHALPNRTPKGACTVLYCAVKPAKDVAKGAKPSKRNPPTELSPEQSVERKEEVAKVKKVQKAVKEYTKRVTKTVEKGAEPAPKRSRIVSTADVGLSDEDDLEDIRAKSGETLNRELAAAQGRFSTRIAALGVPEGLKGADAEEWADGRLVELLPLAVAEKEWSLRYGSPDQRDKAASDVLNATGRGKREASNALGPTIVLVGNVQANGTLQVPWANAVQGAVVQGQLKDGTK